MKREFVTGALDKALSKFTGNNSGNAPVFFILGGFKFSLNTAMFQQIEQSDSYRWRAQERVGQRDALQYTGFGDTTWTLPGVLHPYFKGDVGSMKKLRAMAAEGKPYRLVTGTGGDMGMWVIEKIEVTSSGFTRDLGYRKQEFSITLKKFADAKKV
ncbi:phage tail protein [Stenotrophomonas maltophilia]|uniref:phage tail protein n=1 Tax=Stenotrophomonas maltophilia TaxID=40324 RepID=UPI002B1E70E8|nr:phage tail protein [Stenotrophomonas maltophilia]